MFNLLDSYTESGNDLNSFAVAAQNMDDHTTIETVDFADLQVINFFKRTPEKVICHVIEPEMLNLTDDGTCVINQLIAIRTTGLSNEDLALVKELSTQSKTLFKFPEYNEKYYFLSDSIYKTLSARQTGLGGKLLKTPGYVRNLALAEAFAFNPEKVNMIVRSNGKLKKIFALHKSRFVRHSYESLCHLVRHMDDISYVSWKMNHTETSVYIEFNRIHEDMFIPGLLFKISDTGHCKDCVMTTYRHKNAYQENYFVMTELALTGNFTDMDYIEDVKIRCNRMEDSNLTNLKKFLLKNITTEELCEKAHLSALVGIKGKSYVLKMMLNKLFKDNKDMLESLVDVQVMNFSAYQREQFKSVLINVFS